MDSIDLVAEHLQANGFQVDSFDWIGPGKRGYVLFNTVHLAAITMEPGSGIGIVIEDHFKPRDPNVTDPHPTQIYRPDHIIDLAAPDSLDTTLKIFNDLKAMMRNGKAPFRATLLDGKIPND